MGRYLHFLAKTYFKKAGPYITMAFGVGSFLLLMLPLINSANSELAPGIGSISTFTKFFPFLFSTLFSAISVNHIFKEGELDGSELIIVAKPLTRAQIIITKFLMLFLVIGMYQIIVTLGYMVAAASDSLATGDQKIKFIASLAVGGLIVQIIAAMVIVMISSVLGKVGTTVVSILFAAIVPIVSFTLSPLGKGQGFSVINQGMVRNTITMENDDASNIVTSSSNVYYNVEQQQDKDNYSAYNDKLWYDKAAYGDIWYQWGRFYSMFTDSKNNESLVQRWKTGTVTVTKGNSLALKVKHDATHIDEWIIVNKSSISDGKILPGKVQNGYKYYTNSANQADVTNLKSLPLNERINAINTKIKNIDSSQDSPVNYLASTIVEYKLEQLTTYALPSSLVPANNSGAALSATDYHSVFSDSVELYKVGSKINTLISEDFISTTSVTIGWSFIAILLIGGSMIIFFRRDFK